jgi:transcriptional regulator with XRE-family HTH domain
MIETLKDELKVKGIHYRDVAARLKVSEGTVKRYLRGRALTLAALQKMAEIVDLDLLSLASLAQRSSAAVRGLNKEQEEALSRSPLLRGALYFLGRGWTPAQFGTEFGVADRVDGLLANLQTLGMIRKVSANSFKILARPPLDYRHAGMLTEHTLKRTRRFLTAIDLRDERCQWSFSQARLAPGSEARLLDLVKRFNADVRALGMEETDMPPHRAQWYRVFLGAEPMNPQQLLE